MKRFHTQQGWTLIELLLAMAMTAVVMAPLAAMFRTAAGSAITGRATRDLNSDARFALDRIAVRAVTASSVSDGTGVIVQPGVTPPPPAGTTPGPVLTYAIVGTDLVETENAAAPTTLIGAIVGVVGSVLAPTPARTSIIASNAATFKLTALPTTGQPLLKIELTLRAPGGAGVNASRTVRVGSPT